MEDDILSPRERGLCDRSPDQLPSQSRADLPGYKGEFQRIYTKPTTEKETMANRARAALDKNQAATIRASLQKPLASESSTSVETMEAERPTLLPVVGEKKTSKGIRGWLAKMFGGGE